MAANRASAQQGLTIALIVFVMLTFILAVTTYLFFKKAADADAAMAVANADSAKSKQEMQKAAGDRAKLLGILGFPEEKPVQEVETETNEAFEKKYGDFRDDQKAYLKLSDWLLGAVKSKDDALKTLQAEKLAMETSKDQALADSRNRQNELEQLLKKQEADAEAERAEFNKGREQYEKLTAMLQADLKKANEASDRIKLLIEEIAKGEPLVAVDQQAKYKAAKAEGQVGQLYDELRRRETMISRQNEILADLRVADKSLQDMVLAATPKDDRIDGFDGQVVSVNEVEGTLLLDAGAAHRHRVQRLQSERSASPDRRQEGGRRDPGDRGAQRRPGPRPPPVDARSDPRRRRRVDEPVEPRAGLRGGVHRLCAGRPGRWTGQRRSCPARGAERWSRRALGDPVDDAPGRCRPAADRGRGEAGRLAARRRDAPRADAQGSQAPRYPGGGRRHVPRHDGARPQLLRHQPPPSRWPDPAARRELTTRGWQAVDTVARRWMWRPLTQETLGVSSGRQSGKRQG